MSDEEAYYAHIEGLQWEVFSAHFVRMFVIVGSRRVSAPIQHACAMMILAIEAAQ